MWGACSTQVYIRNALRPEGGLHLKKQSRGIANRHGQRIGPPGDAERRIISAHYELVAFVEEIRRIWKDDEVGRECENMGGGLSSEW
jgi:hypothetical protein